MRIKDKDLKSSLPVWLRHRRYIGRTILIAIFGVICFMAGVVFHKSNVIGLKIIPFFSNPLRSAWNYLKGRTAVPERSSIDLAVLSLHGLHPCSVCLTRS